LHQHAFAGRPSWFKYQAAKINTSPQSANQGNAVAIAGMPSLTIFDFRPGDCMRFCTLVLGCTAVFGFALLTHPLEAQQSAPIQAAPGEAILPAAGALPDSPSPRIDADQTADPQASQQSQPQIQTQNPAPTPAQSSSSSSQSPQKQPGAEETEHQKAEEQLKEQETQRVAGIMATFNTTKNPDALPLSSGQKFRLFFKSAFDPWPFGLSAVVAGIGQAEDSTPEWGQGMEGYAKRFGAGYSDYFLGNFFGNAVLPSLLHEDPRYYQKGSGNAMKRVLWAAASTVWCKRDKGTWGPNWANVGGNLIGSAIGRVYYPASDRTVGGTISDGLTVSAEGVVGAEVIEFWPDLVRRHQRKQAEKQARAIDAAQGQKKEAKPDDPNQNKPAEQNQN
jgi:hypothetical protein